MEKPDAIEKPDKFYKYMTADRAIRLLDTNIIAYSSPHKFNDPFDCSAAFKYENNLKKFRERYREKMEGLYRIEEIENIRDEDRFTEAIKITINGGDPKVISEMIDAFIQDVTIEKLPRMYQSVLSKIKVYCVTTCNANLLMWAHYADEHKGVVIELEPDNKDWLEVDYKDDLLDDVFNLFLDYIAYKKLSQDGFVEFLKKLVETKSDAWKYEKEYRFLIFPESTNQILIKKIIAYMKGKNIHTEKIEKYLNDKSSILGQSLKSNIIKDLIELLGDNDKYAIEIIKLISNTNISMDDPYLEIIPKERIKAVYFGLRTSIEDRVKIMCLVNNMEHIKIYQAYKEDEIFGLKFEEV